MNKRINNICKVEYSIISDVSQYQESPTGTVLIEAAWQELNCATGSELTIEEQYAKAGRSYQSNFICNMKEKLLSKDLLIVRITLDDASAPLIIGDPDLPIRFLESHQLKSKSLSFSHTSWHYPFSEAE